MAEVRVEDNLACNMKKCSTHATLANMPGDGEPSSDDSGRRASCPQAELPPAFDSAYDVTKGFVDCKGFFGEYGGFAESDPVTAAILNDFTQEYLETKDNEDFLQEVRSLQRHWLGRPTPIYHARGLSSELGGAQIYLKREDLAHTGAHKVNHCLGEALLAKKMGKSRIISETSGMHGICLASAAAVVGLKCEVYVGELDWEDRKDDINKMRLMGARVIKVTTGQRNLKEAADKVFDIFINDSANTFYAYSTIAGPQPFPTIVKDFQAIVGEEAREQIQTVAGRLPDHVCGCVAGGSNALGIFQCFLTDDEVKLHAVDPEVNTDAVNLGNPGAGYLESFALLHDINYVVASLQEAATSFVDLSRCDGIMPNWESCYALTQAIRLAPECDKDAIILVNLSGRATPGDVAKALKHSGLDFGDSPDDILDC